MSQEIEVLRSEIDRRFGAIEKWLERLNATVERLGENRERVVILETEARSLRERLSDLEAIVTTNAGKLAAVREDMIRFSVYATLAGALISAATAAVVKKLIGV